MIYWSESSGGHHDGQGLEHRAQVERRRVLDLVSLKERKPSGALSAVHNRLPELIHERPEATQDAIR